MTGHAPFDDGKDSGALRTIGEVCQAFDLKPHVLRYWEQQFPMLQPLKRSGGRRYYRAGDIELLHRINRLVNQEGYTLRGARLALERAAPGDHPGVSERARHPEERNERTAISSEELIAGLRQIRDKLAAALG